MKDHASDLMIIILTLPLNAFYFSKHYDSKSVCSGRKIKNYKKKSNYDNEIIIYELKFLFSFMLFRFP